MKKRAKAISFKLVKAKTDRYTMRTCERALELKRTDPEVWRTLPAQLRREAEEARKIQAQQARMRVQVDPQLIENSRERQAAVRQAMERIHPRIRSLAERNEALANLDFSDVRNGIPALEAVLENMTVPGKRGRPLRKETPKLVRQVRALLAQGVTQYKIAERLFQHPGEEFNLAYSRARAFIRDHRLTPRRK
jgi:small-conductance mechanosensitive channel